MHTVPHPLSTMQLLLEGHKQAGEQGVSLAAVGDSLAVPVPQASCSLLFEETLCVTDSIKPW